MFKPQTYQLDRHQIAAPATKSSKVCRVGLKPGRCFWTNFVHFFLRSSFVGRRCIDIPGVKLAFLQLTSPGPLPTQYWLVVCISRCKSNTTDDVMKTFLAARKMSQSFGQNAEVPVAKKLTSDICRKILITKSYQAKPEF